MIERIQKAAFLLEIICCFGLFYGILCTAMYSFIPDHRLCMAALVLILPFIGSAFGARHLKNVIFFAGYHLIQAILCWLIAPNLQLALILVIYTAAVFIFFFFKRLHQSPTADFLEVSVYTCGIYFILWVISLQLEHEFLCTLLIVSACIFLLLKIVSMYLHNLTEYLKSNKDIANMPVKAIFKSGNSLMTIYMVISVGAMILFTNIGLDKLLSWLKNALLTVIRFLFSLASSNGADIAETIQATEQPPVPSGDMFPTEAAQVSPFMEMLNTIIMTTLQILIGAGAVILVLFLIYRLYRRFNDAKAPKRWIQENGQCHDIVEKLEAPSVKKKLTFFRSSMPEDKIRRIFYKKIRSHYKKKEISPTLTPSQLTADLDIPDSDAAKQFTQIYEKSRYGQYKADNEEIEKYKDLSRKIGK
ncbi:MAG: hypothetical protein ACLU94_04925 [Catenibacillus sp.]